MFNVTIYSKRLADGYKVRNFETLPEAFSFFKKGRDRGFMLDLWYNPDRTPMQDVLYIGDARLINEC